MSDQAKKAIRQAQDQANVERAICELSTEVRVATLVASVRRLHYDASLAKGFTPEQALTLCMNRSL